ncbi:MAG: hypothetical protein WA055_03725 [Candidatus Moraniibacteriota bacterium]
MEARDKKILGSIVAVLFLATVAVFILVKIGIDKQRRGRADFEQQERITQEQKDKQKQEAVQVVDNAEKTQDQEPTKTISVEGTVSAVKDGVVEIKNGDTITQIPLKGGTEVMVEDKK